jgi:hypothetical protein
MCEISVWPASMTGRKTVRVDLQRVILLGAHCPPAFTTCPRSSATVHVGVRAASAIHAAQEPALVVW